MNQFATRAVQVFVLSLTLLVIGSSTNACGQSSVRVSAHREFIVPIEYEKLLTRMEGESTSRKMFRSQHVELLTYTPRKDESRDATPVNSTDDASQSDELEDPSVSSNDGGAVHAIIDSLGCSQEFGRMLYSTSIVANTQQTTIHVELVQPADMLLKDHYRYVIVPLDDYQSSITITHTLDVRLMKRRLRAINDLIFSFTCKEASAQVQLLTAAMERCIIDIAMRPEESTSPAVAGPADENSGEQSSDPRSTSADRSLPKAHENTVQADAKESTSQATESETPADTSVSAKSPDLKVRMKIATPSRGTVRVAVFTSEGQFRKFDARKEESKQGEAYRKQEIQVGAGSTVEYTFEDVPQGNYVIAAFHDIDGNKKLTSSFLGFPSEPYGFSRDARGQLGAPSYQDAEFKFDAEHPLVEFSLK